MNFLIRFEKFLCCFTLRTGVVFTVYLGVALLIYHIANGCLILAKGVDIWSLGTDRDRDGIDGLPGSLTFLAAVVGLIRLTYGLMAYCKKFERLALEKYFLLSFTCNIYDSIEFVLRLIVDNFIWRRALGLPVFIILLWYSTQMVYSLLTEKDEEFRFGSHRKRVQGLKNQDSSSYGSIDPHRDYHRIED
ncbi:unnamed protein product [Moneuplotes crassus]|uniref:Uncharacterized protein n=1 Tax=Euplotes crassus TaxID=5936 RepID=A0AAD1XZC9_EUPCR|nr:unnamed protein product [Moneuplotes crassus]